MTNAQKLGREWIGIDINHLAITLIKNRLADTYGAELKMKVIGEPEDLSGARELAAQDKYQFQWWALGLVGAWPVEQKKGRRKAWMAAWTARSSSATTRTRRPSRR